MRIGSGVSRTQKLLLLSAIAAVGLATAAHAELLSVTFVPYGDGVLPPNAPPHETLVTSFATSAGLSGTYNLETGSSTGNWLAPAYSATSQDLNQYLAVLGGGYATLAIPKETGVEIYIGSWDTYNEVAFSNGLSYSGSTLAGLTGTSPAFGSEFDLSANGWLEFKFSRDEAVTWVTLSSTTNTFEVAAVASSVPELSTWVMMLLGFAGLGFAGYRRAANRLPVGGAA